MLLRSCSRLFYVRSLIVSLACLYSLLRSINEPVFCPYCSLSRIFFVLLSVYYLFVIFSRIKVSWLFEALMLSFTFLATLSGALAEIHWLPDIMSMCSDVN